MNDLGADPSRLLEAKLDSVTDTERAVRATAFVLIPLGLGGVAWCGWLLGLYRRRSEASMQAAIDMTAHEARTDELTGLPNRRALLEELEQRCEANERFTLTLADLNGFKRYNDQFGHPAGDALLRRLGRKLATACEGRGMAARLGGDEFCVLFFEGTPAEEAQALLGEALSDEGEGFSITAASGVAAVPDEARRSASRLCTLRTPGCTRPRSASHPSTDAGDVPRHDEDARRAPPGPRHTRRGGVLAGRELRRGARLILRRTSNWCSARRSSTTSARSPSPRRS